MKFPFWGKRPIFRGKLLVSGTVDIVECTKKLCELQEIWVAEWCSQFTHRHWKFLKVYLRDFLDDRWIISSFREDHPLRTTRVDSSQREKAACKKNMYMLTYMLTNQQKIKPIKVKKTCCWNSMQKKSRSLKITLFFVLPAIVLSHVYIYIYTYSWSKDMMIAFCCITIFKLYWFPVLKSP